MINKQKLHSSNSTKTSKLDSIIANKITNKKDIQAVIKELNNPGSTSLTKTSSDKTITSNPPKKKSSKKSKKKERKSHPQSDYFTEHGTLQFTIPLQPITKKNNGRIIKNKETGNCGFIPSEQYKRYEKDCKYFIPAHYIKDPINVKAIFYMKTKGLVDLTNLNESLHDIMQEYNCIVDDDCKIIISTDGSRVMYDKDNPRTEVTIERIDDYVNPFA